MIIYIKEYKEYKLPPLPS